MSENTRWKDIYRHLKSNGFDVYAPDQKEGYCLEPYIVIKSREVVRLETVSSNEAMYDILLYVPKNRFSFVEEYVLQVIEAMDKLFPMIREAGTQTEPFYDDDVQGYMVSIQYSNYRKRKRR